MITDKMKHKKIWIYLMCYFIGFSLEGIFYGYCSFHFYLLTARSIDEWPNQICPFRAEDHIWGDGECPEKAVKSKWEGGEHWVCERLWLFVWHCGDIRFIPPSLLHGHTVIPLKQRQATQNPTLLPGFSSPGTQHNGDGPAVWWWACQTSRGRWKPEGFEGTQSSCLADHLAVSIPAALWWAVFPISVALKPKLKGKNVNSLRSQRQVTVVHS